MSNDIYLIGEVGYDITLDSVIEKVNQTDKTQPLNVHIHSEGGYVYEGIAIYNYLKSLNQEVNTIAVGLVASIASVFYLAGKKRTAFSQNRILIHLPYGGVSGNAIDMENAARDMREEEDKLSDIYVQETNFTKEEALEQMREDKMFTTTQLKEKGFITELKDFKAVAKLNTNNTNINMNKKDLNDEQKGLLNKFIDFLDLGHIKKDNTKNQITNLLVKTAAQEDLDFFELEDGIIPSVGDKANLNGQPAEGEIVISEILTYVFVGGVLDSIVEPETTEEASPDSEEVAKLKAEIESLKTQVSNSVKKEELAKVAKDYKALEVVKNELETKYTTLVNKLTEFKSTETVETVVVNKKDEQNKKESFSERMERLSKNNKK